MQLVPSPEVVNGSLGTYFGIRWQVTPLLYSFALRRGLSPWRFLVAEPFARQGGSVELFVSPEYVAFPGSLSDRALLRTGVRSYFPVLERGDYVSVSLGASHFLLDGRSGAAFEAGAYVLFGVLGAQITYSPSPLPLTWVATLRFRYF